MADPRDADGGMIDLAAFERLEGERRKAADAEAARNAADELPANLTQDRLRELKASYRQQIEERIQDRRRKRRLLRGGDAAR